MVENRRKAGDSPVAPTKLVAEKNGASGRIFHVLMRGLTEFADRWM